MYIAIPQRGDRDGTKIYTCKNCNIGLPNTVATWGEYVIKNSTEEDYSDKKSNMINYTDFFYKVGYLFFEIS